MLQDYAYKKPRFTDRELIQLFPDCKEIIQEKISEIQDIINEKEAQIGSLLSEIYALETDFFSEWFAEELVKIFLISELQEFERHIIRLKRLLFLFNPIVTNLVNFQDDIEKARNYPIYELARSKLDLFDRGKNFVSLCPFHNEKTPSFYLYTETNTFHCFGCQENGDVIKLTMALHGTNFKEAVAMLKN